MIERQPEASGAPLLQHRRSIRRYLDCPIPEQTLDRLLEAAINAPSAHNRQPWRFVVLRAAADKASLARAMGRKLRMDRLADNDPEDIVEADVARSYARLTGAPALVLVCLTMADMDRYDDERRNRFEHQMAVQSTAMAGQNLLLAASAAGLGACWLCAPMFCPDTVRQALDLPQDWEPQGIITLGYPADTGKPFRRRPVAEVTWQP
ncbi:nitroreductase family protein [Cupriavidus yeoncheonensis]|uniref:nitroreductase family protein n=1 Tax=Cupriavidus yeoncheonensis TaxID=1462994 RepID=UPI001E3C8940|nr:nitroreductase family protein [Cupriavidus yeoncheonensis]